MKTITAFSDSHGAEIPARVISVMGESDFVFFAGDGLWRVLRDLSFLGGKLRAVGGNCDMTGDDEAVAEVESVRFLILHGNGYGTKEELADRARELGCDAVVYGHSHVFDDDFLHGVRLINAGCMSRSPTGDVGYVYMVVNGRDIFANFVKVGAFR